MAARLESVGSEPGRIIRISRRAPAVIAALALCIFDTAALGQQEVRRTQTTSFTNTFRVDTSAACVPSATPTVTPTIAIGPVCIGINNRDIVNLAPACGGAPTAPPPVDPGRVDTFVVPERVINLNSHTYNDIVSCGFVRPIPAINDCSQRSPGCAA